MPDPGCRSATTAHPVAMEVGGGRGLTQATDGISFEGVCFCMQTCVGGGMEVRLCVPCVTGPVWVVGQHTPPGRRQISWAAMSACMYAQPLCTQS